jgi:hypothetical protein
VRPYSSRSDGTCASRQHNTATLAPAAGFVKCGREIEGDNKFCQLFFLRYGKDTGFFFRCGAGAQVSGIERIARGKTTRG